MNAPYEATGWASAIPLPAWPPAAVVRQQDAGPTAPGRPRRATVVALVLAIVVVVAALAAAPAGARPAPGVQDEYTNNGWYTGLEHADLPPRAAEADGSGMQPLTFGIAAALGAALVAATVVATRRRPDHVAA